MAEDDPDGAEGRGAKCSARSEIPQNRSVWIIRARIIAIFGKNVSLLREEQDDCAERGIVSEISAARAAVGQFIGPRLRRAL